MWQKLPYMRRIIDFFQEYVYSCLCTSQGTKGAGIVHGFFFSFFQQREFWPAEER